MIRKICQFVVLFVVSPLVLFSLGLCLAWAAAAEFLGWNDHVGVHRKAHASGLCGRDDHADHGRP